MKLTYEQLRMLAQLGPANEKIVLKNRKGQTVKPAIDKWHLNNLKETRFTSLGAPPRPSPAPSESPFQTSRAPSSSVLRQPRGRP